MHKLLHPESHASCAVSPALVALRGICPSRDTQFVSGRLDCCTHFCHYYVYTELLKDNNLFSVSVDNGVESWNTGCLHVANYFSMILTMPFRTFTFVYTCALTKQPRGKIICCGFWCVNAHAERQRFELSRIGNSTHNKVHLDSNYDKWVNRNEWGSNSVRPRCWFTRDKTAPQRYSAGPISSQTLRRSLDSYEWKEGINTKSYGNWNRLPCNTEHCVSIAVPLCIGLGKLCEDHDYPNTIEWRKRFPGAPNPTQLICQTVNFLVLKNIEMHGGSSTAFAFHWSSG